MTHAEIETLLQTAEEENKRGNFANAEKLAREVLQHLEETKTSSSETMRVRALLALSESLWRRGMGKDALPIAEQTLNALNNAISPGMTELQADVFRHNGIVHMLLSQYSIALDYFEKALLLDDELGNKEGVANHIGNIGSVYLCLSQYEKAIEYYSKAILMDEEIGNKNGVAKHAGNLGSVYLSLSQYANALEFFEKSLAYSKENGEKDGIAKDTYRIGTLYNKLSEYAKSLEYLEMSHMLANELDDKRGVAAATCAIGTVFTELSQHTEALEYYEMALAAEEDQGNKAGVAIATANIGGAYLDLSEYSKGLEFFKEALRLAQEIDDKWIVANQLSNIGYALLNMGNKNEAMEYLQYSLHMLREEIETNDCVVNTLIAIGTVLNQEYRLEDAVEKLEEGLNLAGKLGEKKHASEAHKELASVYEKIGDTEKAFEHTKKHYALKEEIFSDDTRKRVEAFNFRVATANKERDLELARTKAEKAEQALLFKERELANAATSLAAQTELLGNFRQDLRKIVMRPDKLNSEEIIKQVRNKLKELPCEQIDFSKFEGQFATVHPEFRAKLQTLYPDLTPQELRICMLLRVNLQSAAIARLMCVTERAVEFHRLNLRKKFELKKGEDLQKFLAGL